MGAELYLVTATIGLAQDLQLLRRDWPAGRATASTEAKAQRHSDMASICSDESRGPDQLDMLPRTGNETTQRKRCVWA